MTSRVIFKKIEGITSELELDKLSFPDNFNLVSGERRTASVLTDDAQPLLGAVHDLNFAT